MSTFNLLWCNVEGNSAKVHFCDAIHARNYKEQTCQRTSSSNHCKYAHIIIYRVEKIIFLFTCCNHRIFTGFHLSV